MNNLINSAAVARDISLLYELSLAVGRSLDLTTNCAIFLKTLIARKNLAYAAVWISDTALDDMAKTGLATLVFANPEYRVRERHVPISHPMFTLVAQESAVSYCSADPAFSGLITEREIIDGTFALFRLGEIGVLKLFSRTRKAPFERVELRQLGNVIDKFTISVQACLSHQRFLTMQRQVIEAQQALIRELSTPLLPIADHILVMPLIGSLDCARTHVIIETLLAGVAEHRARLVILDITGVRAVDTQVATMLIDVAQAIRLLGAHVMLTGIHPAIAQTLVHLGVDMSGITTYSTLQMGIANIAILKSKRP